METQRLLDLVHFFTFTCHGLLNLWLSCKVNEQVGGYAPKSVVPQALSLQKWVRMLRKVGASVDFCPSFHALGWSCSEKLDGRRPRARIFYKVLPLFGWLYSEKTLDFQP